jgi:hypothetical protein
MPRKSRRKEESPASEPIPLSEALAQSPIAEILASRDPERPFAELAPPEREIVPQPPLGPRKRAVGEPASVYTSVQHGFKLLQDGPFRKFKFNEAPPQQWKDKLSREGFYYVPAEKAWSAAASWQIREASDRLALEFDGKDISHGGRE